MLKIRKLICIVCNRDKCLFIALVFSCLSDVATAQNLVSNGGFEESNCIPKIVAQWNCAKDWFPANAGSPDMYNRASPRRMGIPENNLGTQDTHSGSVYAGLILLDKYEGIVEYIETKLIKPLLKDKKYYFSMYVSLADKSMYGINSIGAYFSNTKVTRGKWEGIYVNPQIANNPDSILYNPTLWYKIDGYYTAEGGEQYLTIGNFTKEDQIKRQQINDYYIDDVLSYYYLDDVSIVEVKESNSDGINEAIKKETNNKLIFEESKLKPGANFELKNIYFNFDESNLQSVSSDELEKVFDLLQSHPAMRIEIRGYTDSKGSDAHNSRLSTYRARAVVEYLKEKGINANRLRYKGYGSKLPASTNMSDKGRGLNRRVEFVILKM